MVLICDFCDKSKKNYLKIHVFCLKNNVNVCGVWKLMDVRANGYGRTCKRKRTYVHRVIDVRPFEYVYIYVRLRIYICKLTNIYQLLFRYKLLVVQDIDAFAETLEVIDRGILCYDTTTEVVDVVVGKNLAVVGSDGSDAASSVSV